MKTSAIILALLSVSLLSVQWVTRQQAEPLTGQRLSEKVNLALRRTAHYLLAASGDTTSRIPPVQQVGDSIWLIRLERPFNYDTLPELLSASFEVHGIDANYNVAVLDCKDGEVQLGYNFLDFLLEKEVPCGGRELESGCYNLQVTFVPPNPQKGPLWVLISGGVLALLAIGGWWWTKQQIPPSPIASPAEVADPGVLQFGNSSLDPANLILFVNGIQHQLTYREAKLLQLFLSHSNLLLEREFILKSVWEDEGIIVGRSLDVFVSRLRKLLKADNAVQIATVHGVGYRLEVG
ncbi:MAG: response regulator transcription factor [Saprospiraceae bacterium]|nr:response regulator transcription factor [Saprospiraceae bacterium]